MTRTSEALGEVDIETVSATSRSDAQDTFPKHRRKKGAETQTMALNPQTLNLNPNP